MGWGSRSSCPPQTPRHVARRLHWRGRLCTCTGAHGLAEAPRRPSRRWPEGRGCGALNMWWDADIDANMARTAMRPIPRGVVPPLQALAIGFCCSVVSVAALAIKVNVLAAALLVLTIAIYVPLYTMVLKRSTSMNIVIGGAAGALPPVIGWAAAVNSVSAGSVAMFLIIFLWTPPHFWALALCRSGDYERVGVPMLPNVVGPVKTCRQIVAYSILLVPASLGADADPGRWRPLRRRRCWRERRIPLARARPVPPGEADESPAGRPRWLVRLLNSLSVRPVRSGCSPRAFCGDAFNIGGSGAAIAQRSRNANLDPNLKRRKLDRPRSLRWPRRSMSAS